MATKIYTIGSFSGWRDELAGKLSENYEFDDPRDHSQSSIARLVTDDMNSAMNCPISLIYTPEGKRAGTMSYAELGAAWAMGNGIVSVDENEKPDRIINTISREYYKNFDAMAKSLNDHGYCDRGEGLEIRDRTESEEICRHVMLVGNHDDELVDSLSRTGKSMFVDPDPDYFADVQDQVDLIVANFDKGHDSRGLFYMGVGYATKTPVIMVEGNSVPYPPLLGLARRVMVGDKRHEQLAFYLENLKSQHVSEEAVVYYNLMKKFD